VRLHQTEPTISDCGKITIFPEGVGLALQDELKRGAQNLLTESETVSIISDMACTIFHDMRQLLSAIYANAEFLDRPDMSAHVRAEIVYEIQEVVLEMTERLDSLLQFACSGRRKPLVHERVSTIVKKAIAAVKSHPSGRNVSIRVGKFPLAEADT
jgi:signal transduction histidine kinase